MGTAPHLAGPQHPVVGTPPRRPGSVRRTTTIDSLRPDGLEGSVVIDARGRDLHTRSDGSAVVVDTASVRGRVDPRTTTLESIGSDPEVPALSDLVGSVVGSGFRAKLARALPDGAIEASLLHLLLDDLTGAELVAGYALQHGGVLGTVEPLRLAEEHVAFIADVCAGWANDASLLTVTRATGEIPTPLGPPAPVLEPTDDPWAWHESAGITPYRMRRRRRIDLRTPDGGVSAFDAHFRDTHVDGVGAETVVHEYSVSGTVDVTEGRLLTISTVAQVLPWLECPSAVASAQRMAGTVVGDLRTNVRRELTGVSTCTHLNDTLRSLADLEHLAALL